jgi:hypothetical protein
MIPAKVSAGDPNRFEDFSKPPSANNADEIAASVVHPAQTKVSRVRLLRRRSVHAQPLS